MALIAPQRVDIDGATISYAAAGASDTIRPDPRGVLLYRTSGTPSNLSIVIPGNDDNGQAKPDIAVALGATVAVGLATVGLCDDVDANGLVTITSSSQTGLTVAYVLV